MALLRNIEAGLSAVSDPSTPLTQALRRSPALFSLSRLDCAPARNPSHRDSPATITNPRRKRVPHP